MNYTISYILMNELSSISLKWLQTENVQLKKLIIWNIWREYEKTDRVIEVEQAAGQGRAGWTGPVSRIKKGIGGQGHWGGAGQGG